MGCYGINYWKQKSHQCLSFQFFLGEKELFDKKEIAETFNRYFVNIGPNLAASICQSKTSFQNYVHYDGPFLRIVSLTDLELENAFASLKANKSSGYDDIFADIVKRKSDEICVILKHISISL